MVYESGSSHNKYILAGDACHRCLGTSHERTRGFPSGRTEHKTGSSHRHFLCHHHWRFGNSWHGGPWLQQWTTRSMVDAFRNGRAAGAGYIFCRESKSYRMLHSARAGGLFLWGEGKICRLRPHCYLLGGSHCGADRGLRQGARCSIWRKRDPIHGCMHDSLRALHSSRRAGLGDKDRPGTAHDNISGNDSPVFQSLGGCRTRPAPQPELSHICKMGGWDVLSMLLVVGSAYLVGPDMYSRLFSAHSPTDAKISAAIAAIILIPLAFLITSLGIFARSLYPAASPEQAIPVLMTGLLSPGY